LRKRDIIFRVLDIIGLTAQIFLLIIIAANLYNLFLIDLHKTSLVILGLVLSYSVYVFREKNLQSIIAYHESNEAYKSVDQVVYDLQVGEIVCFRLDGDLGVLYLTDESEFVVYFENQGATFTKDITEKRDIINLVKSFMDQTHLFKNGVIFNATKHKLETVDDLISSENKEQGGH
jgi:hypothetical protein